MIIYPSLTAPGIALISSIFLGSSISVAPAQHLVDKLPTSLVGLTWNQADYPTLDGFKTASDKISVIPGGRRVTSCDLVIRRLQLRKGDDVISIDIFVSQEASEDISNGLWGMLMDRYSVRIPKIESGVSGVRLHGSDGDFFGIAGNLGFNISVRGRPQRVVDDSGNNVLETYSSITEVEPLMRSMLNQVLVQNSREQVTAVSVIDEFKATPVVMKSKSSEDMSVISITPSELNPEWIPIFAESDDLVLSINPGEILVHDPEQGTERTGW